MWLESIHDSRSSEWLSSSSQYCARYHTISPAFGRLESAWPLMPRDFERFDLHLEHKLSLINATATATATADRRVTSRQTTS